MTDQDDIIVALRAENAKLAARIRELDPPPSVPEVDGPFCMPSVEQARVLFTTVADAHPQLCKTRELDERAMADFANAFYYVGSLFRTPGSINTRSSVDQWCAWGAAFLRERFHSNHAFTAPMFAIACAAHGDVDMLALAQWPHVFGCGLNIGEPPGARRPRNEWLRVLRDGRLRPATTIERRRLPPRRVDILIRGGDQRVGSA